MPIEMQIEKDPSSCETSSPSWEALDPDAQLVAATKHGDMAAFEQLVARHQRRIFRLALRITGNHEDAQEITQTSFQNAFVHLAKFRGDSRFYTWLARITINGARMRLRSNHESRTVSLDELTGADDALIPAPIADRQPTPEQRFSQEELRHALAGAISRLSPALRVAFQLRYVEELSGPQTAQILRLSLAAVKARSIRARLKLREWLNETLRSE
jgi:RNA polymerase sigma-70 factor, ECF subfamily